MSAVGGAMALITDFDDFYDEHFVPREGASRALERLAAGRDRRREDHAAMASAGLEVPRPRGTLRDLASMPAVRSQNPMMVAYVNELAHRGEGKMLGTFRELYELLPNDQIYAAQWYDCLPAPGVSYRALAIGREVYWLRYTNVEREWRSNVGNVEITLEEPEVVSMSIQQAECSIGIIQRKHGRPLLAVDFVVTRAGALVAVDLNTAPGMRGSPIELKIRSVDVYAALSQWSPR